MATATATAFSLTTENTEDTEIKTATATTSATDGTRLRRGFGGQAGKHGNVNDHGDETRAVIWMRSAAAERRFHLSRSDGCCLSPFLEYWAFLVGCWPLCSRSRFTFKSVNLIFETFPEFENTDHALFCKRHSPGANKIRQTAKSPLLGDLFDNGFFLHRQTNIDLFASNA